MTDPAQLSPLEQYVEALIRFDNFDRYRAQSAATGVAAPAPLPPRAPLLPIFTTERKSA